MDADSSVSADLVLVALDAARSHPPPTLPCHVTRAGPPPVGPVRSTPERTHIAGPCIRVVITSRRQLFATHKKHVEDFNDCSYNFPWSSVLTPLNAILFSNQR